MPRGRPKKTSNSNTTNENNNLQTEEVTEDYAKKFFSVIQNVINGNSAWLYNPIWTNEILKDLNMFPQKYSRDRVKELIANPRTHEKELKELSEYLFNVVTQYKRLILYMAESLTFDWFVEPTNADEEDMIKPTFKNAYKKVIKFMNDLDPKLHFPDIVQTMLLEDGGFYYLRESDNGYHFQEMPSQYCKIWAKTDLGFAYAFDLTYFLRPGVDFRDFDPVFQQYFNDFINSKEYKENKNKFKERRWFYWQTLDISKSFVFKFDTRRAGLTPPWIGTFLDAIEITTYKDLLKSKSAIDIYRLLVAKIPLNKEAAQRTNKVDNFAISAEQAAKFQAIMQNAVQQGIKVIASPLEIEAINLNQSENKDSIVGLGNQEFWDTSGTSSVLFSGNKMNASTMGASLRTDETFVTHLYRQIEKFYNFKLREISPKYRFKIHIEGTIHDKKDRLDRAMQLIPYGSPLTYAIVAQGRTQSEFVNVLNFETLTGMRDKMKPLLTSHTAVSQDSGGRPRSENIENENTEVTRDNESNIR